MALFRVETIQPFNEKPWPLQGIDKKIIKSIERINEKGMVIMSRARKNA
jgi:hypothetical protein